MIHIIVLTILRLAARGKKLKNHPLHDAFKAGTFQCLVLSYLDSVIISSRLGDTFPSHHLIVKCKKVCMEFNIILTMEPH